MMKIVRTAMDGRTITEWWPETKAEADELDAMVARGELAGGSSFASQRTKRLGLDTTPPKG